MKHKKILMAVSAVLISCVLATLYKSVPSRPFLSADVVPPNSELEPFRRAFTDEQNVPIQSHLDTRNAQIGHVSTSLLKSLSLDAVYWSDSRRLIIDPEFGKLLDINKGQQQRINKFVNEALDVVLDRELRNCVIVEQANLSVKIRIQPFPVDDIESTLLANVQTVVGGDRGRYAAAAVVKSFVQTLGLSSLRTLSMQVQDSGKIEFNDGIQIVVSYDAPSRYRHLIQLE